MMKLSINSCLRPQCAPQDNSSAKADKRGQTHNLSTISTHTVVRSFDGPYAIQSGNPKNSPSPTTSTERVWMWMVWSTTAAPERKSFENGKNMFPSISINLYLDFR